MMRFRMPIIVLGLLVFTGCLDGCSSEPKTVEECIQNYSKGVKNKNAVQEITKACSGIFDAREADDAYYKCLLERLPDDETDKDVNISIRQCTMKTGQ